MNIWQANFITDPEVNGSELKEWIKYILLQHEIYGRELVWKANFVLNDFPINLIIPFVQELDAACLWSYVDQGKYQDLKLSW